MENINDLKNKIEELKKEVPTDSDIRYQDFLPRSFPINKKENIKDRIFIPNRNNLIENEKKFSPKFNIIWSENKETLLFGMLISVIVVILGIMVNTEYIIITGTISFILFSFISFLVFLRYITIISAQNKVPPDLRDRIDKVEDKIEALINNKNIYLSDNRNEELNEKIEELKTIIRTLVKK